MTGLQIIVNAPAGSSFDIALRYKSDTGCTTTGPVLTVNSATYATFDGLKAQELLIPFADFKGIDSTRLSSLSFQKFSAAGQGVSFHCVSLAKVARAAAPPACLACPAPAVLDYCTSPATNANALGGVSGDDKTMAVSPALAAYALALVPTAGSYWYTNIACVDYTYYKYLYLTVRVPAGAAFNVELQSAAAAGAGCPAGGATSRATVPAATYGVPGTPDGVAQNITIPLTAFRAVNAAIDFTRVTALSLTGFSPADAKSTYSVTCAFWSRYGVSGAAMVRRKARGFEEDDVEDEEDVMRGHDEL